MPETPEPGKRPIAVSLVQGEFVDSYRYGMPEADVDTWYRLTWDLGAWFKERGYEVAVTGFSISTNGKNATLNVTPRS